MLRFFRERRRSRLRAAPFPPLWSGILERNLGFYTRLTPEDRAELEGHIQVFLAEKRFEGAGGLNITDEIRVTIAGQAALLLLRRDADTYPGLSSIIVYPGAYQAPTTRQITPGIVEEGPSGRLGEAWSRGAVVLAWDHVRRSARDPHDGHNLVLHEFAHVLDQEDGVSDGTPVLGEKGQLLTWARILGEEYIRLRGDASLGRSTLLDQYGATNPAEFFAVATELFFEKPAALRRTHPELFEELRDFFRQDPELLIR